ncbi:MAG: HD domain-containing protein [Deltaproteobacteria bacterium]|nr:HD domain-containing protein [Deltaproteobacteria bacterium]
MIESNNNNDILQLKKWFNKYIDAFEMEYPLCKENFILKKKHSHLVSKEMVTIARSIGLDSHEIDIAQTIGLLHDIGRFPQMAEYNTFNDHDSVDHGKLGVDVIRKHNLLHEMDDYARSIVETAVLLHNKASLPRLTDRRYNIFAELIRDADKLDIFRVDQDVYLFGDSTIDRFPKGLDVSEGVYEEIVNKKMVSNCNIKNQIDLVLFRIGWFFDINFASTLNMIIDRGYYARLRSMLPDTDKIRNLLKVVDNYIMIHAIRKHFTDITIFSDNVYSTDRRVYNR